MEIQEIRKKKLEAEESILKILEAFEDDTDTKIKHANTSITESSGGFRVVMDFKIIVQI